MIALDDAAWGAPWRQVRVGEKLALGGGLILTALVAPAWPAAPLVALAAVALTLGPARIPARVLAIGFAAPLAFITLGAISVAIQVGAPAADAWWQLGPLSMNAATAATGIQLFGRSAAGTLAVLLLATTTPMVDLLGWARRRGVPGPLVEVASLTYRLLFVLLAVATNIRAAQIARLADAPGGGRPGFVRRWQGLASAIGALLVRSWDRAARLTEGLAARGIDGDLVTLPIELPASPRFQAATVATLALIWAAVLGWVVLG